MQPPASIPPELLPIYTMNGLIAQESWYHNESQTERTEQVFSFQTVSALIEKARRREANYYGDTDTFLFAALDHFPIKDKDCVIMGTQEPWYEAISLERGVRSCTTIEYWKMRSEYPGLKFMTPEEYDKNPLRFDVGFSISSFEHDGLGRYGDPINPNGDLEAMRKMKKILRPGGLLFLAVPVAKDKIVWNAHRIYGRHRLPLLIDGWELLGSVGFKEEYFDTDTGKDGCFQPIFVLKNT